MNVNSCRDRLIAPTLQAFQAAPCIDGSASSSVVLAPRDFCLLIAIDRINRAGDPSIKLVLLARLSVPNRSKSTIFRCFLFLCTMRPLP